MLTIPGKRDGGQIIAGAHYDGSGVGDNDSGVALLLATATGLVHAEPEFTLKLVFFNREEEAKVGSRFYAGRMSGEAVASTLCMINLDALAFGDFCNIYGGVYGDNCDVGLSSSSKARMSRSRNRNRWKVAILPRIPRNGWALWSTVPKNSTAILTRTVGAWNRSILLWPCQRLPPLSFH